MTMKILGVVIIVTGLVFMDMVPPQIWHKAYVALLGVINLVVGYVLLTHRKKTLFFETEFLNRNSIL